MKRRAFLKSAGLGALVAGGALTGCQPRDDEAATKAGPSVETVEWKMVTTWPKNFPGLGTGAESLGRLISEMSGGRIRVKVYGAGELVPAFEIFDAVSRGTAQMGHGAAYYWRGKNEAFQFFSTVPFGLTANEMDGWLFHGGGLELWREAYEPYNLIPAPAGNTGVQMAGWFNKEVDKLSDLKGLKMRIPGLGGEVLNRAGGTPVNLPGGELFTAMQTGAIDATEWVGPYNDLAFGLHKVAKLYYYPGWHEPGTTLEAIINKQAFEALSTDLQSIVLSACRVANHDMLAEYSARNNDALETLMSEHQVEVRRLPDPVLTQLRALSEEVVGEIAQREELAARIFDSYSAFRQKVIAWHDLSDRAYLNARLPYDHC